MSAWLERKLPEFEAWNLSPIAEPSENEMAYLYNDIGPLLYVFNSVTDEMREEALK